jgi:hypothetical protein
MYELFTTSELYDLKKELYEATEQAFWVATCKPDDAYWTRLYRSVHRDMAFLFLDVGGELARRLNRKTNAA